MNFLVLPSWIARERLGSSGCWLGNVMAREEEADPAVFDACAAFSPRASQFAILSWDDDAPGHSEKELVMDRDQVNCLHYLFQGDPIDKLPPDWWERDREKPPEDRLFWCPKDTTDPLYNRNILQGDEDGYLQLPTPCKDLLDVIEQQLEAFPRPNYVFGYPLKAAIRKQGEKRPAFLAIPYAAPFEPVKTAVLHAASRTGFACEVPGDSARPGPIMDQIWQDIRRADVVVADTTGANPNVMLELGVAAALGKEVVLISQDEELPFDLKDWRKLAYTAGNLDALEAKLMDAFACVSARYPHEGKEPPF